MYVFRFLYVNDGRNSREVTGESTVPLSAELEWAYIPSFHAGTYVFPQHTLSFPIVSW